MNRRTFLKGLAGATVVAAVAPVSVPQPVEAPSPQDIHIDHVSETRTDYLFKERSRWEIHWSALPTPPTTNRYTWPQPRRPRPR